MRLICKNIGGILATDTNDVNFFSSVVSVLVETFDLANYLIRDTLSPFGYDPEDVDSQNNLVIKASRLKFQLKNDISGTKQSFTVAGFLKCIIQ